MSSLGDEANGFCNELSSRVNEESVSTFAHLCSDGTRHSTQQIAAQQEEQISSFLDLIVSEKALIVYGCIAVYLYLRYKKRKACECVAIQQIKLEDKPKKGKEPEMERAVIESNADNSSDGSLSPQTLPPASLKAEIAESPKTSAQYPKAKTLTPKQKFEEIVKEIESLSRSKREPTEGRAVPKSSSEQIDFMSNTGTTTDRVPNIDAFVGKAIKDKPSDEMEFKKKKKNRESSDLFVERVEKEFQSKKERKLASSAASDDFEKKKKKKDFSEAPMEEKQKAGNQEKLGNDPETDIDKETTEMEQELALRRKKRNKDY